MKTLGNVLWFILVGFVGGLSWVLAGIFWCITIVGIPLGVQCFKFAGLTFLPFGKEVEFSSRSGHVVLNIFWLLLCGIEMAIVYSLVGIVFYITIIGIPFGKQTFKIAKLALMPFGAQVIERVQ